MVKGVDTPLTNLLKVMDTFALLEAAAPITDFTPNFSCACKVLQVKNTRHTTKMYFVIWDVVRIKKNQAGNSTRNHIFII